MLDAVDPCQAVVVVGISEGPATPIFLVRRELTLQRGRTSVLCNIPHLPLGAGSFSIWASVVETDGVTTLLPWQPVVPIEVFGPEVDAPPMGVVRLAPVHVDSSWQAIQGHGELPTRDLRLAAGGEE